MEAAPADLGVADKRFESLDARVPEARVEGMGVKVEGAACYIAAARAAAQHQLREVRNRDVHVVKAVASLEDEILVQA